jgi:TrmH family RNA methyltransferase
VVPLTDRSATRAELRQLEGLARVRERRAAGECLVEGATLLAEALDAGLAVRVVAVSEELVGRHEPLLLRARDAGAELLLAPEELLARTANREHGLALLAAVRPPAEGRLSDLPATGPVLVPVLCGLQDPGNVGTLLRSSRAFGASLCVTLPGCADIWGPKVIRSSAGAVFSQPALRVDQFQELMAAVDLQPVAAMPPRATTASSGSASLSLPERCLLLLGHETRGLEPASAVSEVTVPQAAGVDSLNVAMAGSILMASWYADRGL